MPLMGAPYDHGGRVKLFFDQNLSFKLCDRLADLYPGTTQARLVGFDRATDREIWRFAAENGFGLVSQDSDLRKWSHFVVRRRSSSGCAVEISQRQPWSKSCVGTARKSLLLWKQKPSPPSKFTDSIRFDHHNASPCGAEFHDNRVWLRAS
ncbi:DUF5615 family PIN-like protein [Aurantimonas sp. C2-6-R+9]|uniref:DUF5615 family PIN-like protein n=1 Tax=unclassified Aurantimonas TaxID=2638230 RepID=UPI002E17B6C1|nr:MULTISPECIES: DUF5615 family PIN-like protein [unclassified Aurantimonas]MEC5290629.1 DUF5615 family PIN-like protein [Aurantimonas sp. C2-3-R2]MEC5380657.1 DUF5615 family PIN-like protein [Aurantimonas sp. C2-6-R+9]MEC5411703.1 DUF5615 family PIN-like protein [Aurantimonas sp. C2-4-R8]